ncbi:hypothetical protein MSP8886_01441 [Marinomonas spartinae]|uniref:Uncharacterized protein n=1 Tax=Marinomonas spartinae TaxID=1792290 RepID=A0A1A8T8U3_9GAMM|nr:hypothetical protein [Marinomonas spartinae]SBS29107.1 hypothetical protein MSP8886_01441 [Marinomonas spartinae]
MSDTRHQFIITATDRTRAAFDSAKANFQELKKTALSAQSLIAAGLGGVGIVSFTKEMASLGESSLIAADNLNTTTEQITSLQYAASKYNIDGEAMNDVLKDMSVRIQEFATIGTGEAADFFETLNLNVKDFVDLAPDKLLYKVAQELDGLSDASARVYLDQLGSDNLVALLPLLRNSAKGLREMQDEAYATNKVLKQTDAIKLAAIANEINVMQNAAKTLSQQLAAEFEPAVKGVSDLFNDFASDGDAVSNALDTMSTAGTVVASVYAGRMTTAFVTSMQAKFADTVASKQNAAANVEEAKAALAKAEIKLTTEQLAYKESIAAKKRDAAESEKLSASNLERAKSAQAAAAADVEAASALKSHAAQLDHAKQRADKLKAAEAELTASKARLATATQRAEKAEQAHQAQVAKNSAAIQVATDNTKKLDRAKLDLEKSTQRLTTVQKAHNASMRAGSIAARGLSSALGLVGGPIGLLFTGVTVLSMLQSSAADATEEIDLLGVSTDQLNNKLATTSYNNLTASLDQVNEKIAASSAKIKALQSEKVEHPASFRGRSGNVKSKSLQKEMDEKQSLMELGLSISTEIEARETRVKKAQTEARKQISTQALNDRIKLIQTASQTAEQSRKAAFDKQMSDITSFYDKEKSILDSRHKNNLISNKEYKEKENKIELDRRDLKFKTKQSYALQEERFELAQRQKRLAAFSENYTKREQMTLEHQQRVLQYMQDNGITNDQDAKVIAFQKESYDYQLKMFKEYQKGILKGYDDYGKTELQKEKDRYAEEIKLLDKHLRDKDITQKQYDSAKLIADKRTAENQKKAEQQDLETSLNKQRDFNNLFVGMANSKNKELAAIGKAAAIYNIGIQTYQGAMAAYTALAPIPIVGPALGIAAAAALTAYGLEQVGNVKNQTYHTGGIAGQDSDNYSARLAANEVPAILLKGEEVLTQTDPRHRNNLTLSKDSTGESGKGSTINQISFGDIVVQVSTSKSSNSTDIGQAAGEQIATQIVAVLKSKVGQKLVYNGVSAEAGRNGGKIKGVR